MEADDEGMPEHFDATELEDEEEEDEEGEEADLHAQVSDVFILVGTTEDEYSSLEVHCFNTDDGSLYVHHDITLPTYPLALAWLDYAGDAAGGSLSTVSRAGGSYVGSFVAVGGFDPAIELWNLDVLDPLEPVLVLKAGAGRKKRGSRRTVSTTATGGHTDAVTGLSWNQEHRHMLASASADSTVKVWDLDGEGVVLHTFRHHEDKVDAVAWNPSEHTILASVSSDCTAAVWDARAADSGRVGRYALPGEPESLLWNVHSPMTFMATTANGHMVSYDCRVPDTPLWDIQAHGQACTAVAQSTLARGFLATSSLDKSVRLWDINSGEPLQISGKAMGIGQVFTVTFAPGKPFLLAAGGSKGMLAVWDVAEDGGDITEAALSAAPGGGRAEFSATANRFHERMADPDHVPGLRIRPRDDGQALY
jgi:periodic tryptophan protein 1